MYYYTIFNERGLNTHVLRPRSILL